MAFKIVRVEFFLLLQVKLEPIMADLKVRILIYAFNVVILHNN